MSALLELTRNQRLLWTSQQVRPEPIFNEVSFFIIHGAIDPDRFERAFLAVVERSDALRMVVDTSTGEPRLRVLDHDPGGVVHVDLSRESDPDAALEVWLRDRADRMLDLSRCCWETVLIKLADDRFGWYTCAHHLITDGVSFYVLYNRVGDCYARLGAGGLDGLGDYPSFAEWVAAEGERRATTRHARADAYWRAKLAERCPPLSFYGRPPRPRWSSSEKVRIGHHLGPTVSEAIDRVCARAGAESRSRNLVLFSAMTAAYAAFLHRLTGNARLAIGTPFHNRRRELFDVIGVFMEQAPLYLTVEPNDSLLTLMRKVRSEVGQVMRHLPYAPGNPGGEVFEVGINLLTVEFDDFAGHPATTRWLHAGAGEETLALHIHDLNRSGRLTLDFDFNCATFEPSHRELAISHFVRLLESMLADPDRPVAELDLVTEGERALLESFNATSVTYPSAAGATLHGLIAAQAARTPDAEAVVFEGESLTYAELEARAERLAGCLRERGVGPEVLVGVCMERSPELVVSLLAVLKAGGAYVPLDPAYPAARLADMLADAEPPLVLTQGRLEGALRSLGLDVPVVAVDRDWAELAASGDGAAVGGEAGPGNAAYVIFTSGSTGRPKGVVNEHRGIVNRLLWMQDAFGLGAGDRVLQKTPYGFDVSVWEFFWPLMTGATLVVARPGGHREPDYLVETIVGQNVTTIHFVPSMLQVFLGEEVERCGSLKRILCSGEALGMDAAARTLERLPWAGLYNLYGPTEAAVDVTWWKCEPGWQGASVPIGRPVANTEIHILDAEGRPAPIGVPGELYIGGVQVARGYLKRPELTAERFVPDPFRGGEAKLYRTGDLAYWRPDGAVEFLGRLDHQVKVRGFRIELGEIEVRLRELEEVSDCVVTARRRAAGDQRLVAYVVLAPGRELDAASVRRRLGETLPKYMVPGVLVALDALPLSPNGKVDRHALPDPRDAAAHAAAGYEAPVGEVEAAVAEVWREILGEERVGRRDNFFALGGDSLLLIRMVGRLKALGWEAKPQHAFAHPTVAELSRVVSRRAEPVPGAGAAGAAGTAPDVAVGREVPLTPIQRWFFEEAPAEVSHWNQSLVLEVPADVDAAALERALAALVRHHDALRLRFWRGEDGVWRQRYGEAWAVALARHELSGDASSDRRTRLESIGGEVQASLDIEAGRVLGAAYVRIGGVEAGRLLLVAHHLVVDAVSWPALVEDLERAYAAELSGEALALPGRMSSYGAWSERLASYAASATAAERAFWADAERHRRVLVPEDGPGGANLEASTRQVVVELDEAATERLLREGPRHYRTRGDELLLTALALALAPEDGGAFTVDVEGHGRESLWDDLDVSRTVGWFTSLYPVVLEVPAERRAGTAVRSVKERLRTVPNNGVGYGVLRYLTPEGVAGGSGGPAGSGSGGTSSQVTFNFIGRVDGAGGGRFGVVDEGMGSPYGAAGRRRFPLEVVALVRGGRLRVIWRYGEDLHRRETVEGVAARMKDALGLLAELPAGEAKAAMAPSDFPLARLEPDALARIAAAVEGEIEDIYALAPLQQGLLVLSVLEKDANAYHLQAWISVEGPLDAESLRRVWERTVSRHDILRAGFFWEGLEEPVQVVRRTASLHWHEEDWGALEESERESRMAAFLEADREAGFTLDMPPLCRVMLIRTGEARWELVWSAHHLIVDGWSRQTLLAEVFAGYAAETGGVGLVLDRALPYRDYVALLRERATTDAEWFWRERLRGFREPTLLDVDRGVRNRSGRYAWEDLALPEERTAEVESLARGWRVTLSTVVQGAWALLLSRYSGREDVVFGTSMTTRPPELEGAEERVGLYLNTLPVRVAVPADGRAAAWLASLQLAQSEVRGHETVPLMDVQRWSDVPPGTQLFETLVVFENHLAQDVLAPLRRTLAVRRSKFYEHTHYPLTLFVISGKRLQFGASYDTGRFGEETVRRLLAHLHRILDAFLAEPERSLGELALVAQAEVDALAAGPRRPAPAEPCVHRQVRARAAERPDAVAVRCGEERYTYGELVARAERYASLLRERGVGRGDLVGVCVERSAEMVAALLGVLEAGAAYVPVDPEYPPDRVDYILEDAGVKALVTEASLAGRLAPERVAVVLLGETADAGATTGTGARPGDAVGEHDLAYVIYTSGSTGRPKGVEIPHGALANFLEGMREEPGLGADDVLLAVTTIAFDIAGLELWLPLTTGARVEVAPASAAADAEAIMDLIERSGVTVLQATPSTWRMLLDVDWTGDTRLRALCGGEAMPKDLASALLPRVGELWNMYGPTETTIWSSAHRITDEDVVVGRPMRNTTFHVLDARGRHQPVGVVGELWIGGAGLARGYHDRPELTAERFRPDPFAGEAGARLYRTGDLVRWRFDGTLEFLGRSDHQVKVRGHRIELGEIETVLAGQPGVRQAAVVARGEAADKRLVAYLVLDDGRELVAGELRRELARTLPDYMVPGLILPLDALPLTPNGKVDRNALPDPLQGGGAEREYEPAANEIERVIAAIWQELLGVERVGRHDNFFELGGHSLLAMRAASALAARSRIESNPRELFFRTVAELAAAADGVPVDPPVAASVEPSHGADLSDGRGSLARGLARIRALFAS